MCVCMRGCGHLQTREELREALEGEIRSFTVDKVWPHVDHVI